MREAAEDQDDVLEYAGGEFDEDEPVDSVTAARDVKKLAVSVRGKVSSKIHLTVLSIPLPSSIDGRNYCKNCRRSSFTSVFQRQWPSREEGKVHACVPSISSWGSKYVLHS